MNTITLNGIPNQFYKDIVTYQAKEYTDYIFKKYINATNQIYSLDVISSLSKDSISLMIASDVISKIKQKPLEVFLVKQVDDMTISFTKESAIKYQGNTFQYSYNEGKEGIVNYVFEMEINKDTIEEYVSEFIANDFYDLLAGEIKTVMTTIIEMTTEHNELVILTNGIKTQVEEFLVAAKPTIQKDAFYISYILYFYGYLVCRDIKMFNYFLDMQSAVDTHLTYA